jgi:phosphonate transport system permease protein
LTTLTPTASPLHDPAGRERVLWVIAAIAILVPAGWFAEFNPATLWGDASLRATRQFLASFFPPRLDAEFLQLVAVSTWKTIAIATVGTTLAVLIALPLALVANRQLSISAFAGGRMCAACMAVRSGIRWLLILLRSVPEIVWALLFVRAVGLGDTAGVIAIALTYGGMLGKVYIEIFESNEAQATRALLVNGASRTQAFLYGTLPVCLPELTSYTIYRWECAIRASVVMGFVGAGGLGQQMELSMKMLAGGEVLTMLLVFVGLVFLADAVSGYLRRWLA